MQLSLFKRVKHGHLPGDVGKDIKIAMRERRWPEVIRAAIYRRDVARRTRAVLAERARREIANVDCECMTI